jgi:autotransporter adhesin
MRRLLVVMAMAGIAVGIPATAFADTSPNGPGQPGAPGTTCGSPGATSTPGGSVSAGGSVFNPNGTAGTVYAGNPGTASAANAQSTSAVSQYDIACFQVTPGH